MDAHAQGANYIAFGSIYNSPTKPHASTAELSLISSAKQKLGLPICAIGGIQHNNAEAVLEAGADMIAVISAIFNTNSPSKSVEKFLHVLQEFDLNT